MGDEDTFQHDIDIFEPHSGLLSQVDSKGKFYHVSTRFDVGACINFESDMFPCEILCV